MWSRSWINLSGCHTQLFRSLSLSFFFILAFFVRDCRPKEESLSMMTFAAQLWTASSEMAVATSVVTSYCCCCCLQCILTFFKAAVIHKCRSLLLLVYLFRLFFFTTTKHRISSRVTIQQTGKHFCLKNVAANTMLWMRSYLNVSYICLIDLQKNQIC